MRADGDGIIGGRIKTNNRIPDIFPCLRVDIFPGDAGDHGFACPAVPIGDDGFSSSHGLNGRDAEVLHLRMDKTDTAGEQIDFLVVAYASEKFRSRSGQGFQTGSSGPVPKTLSGMPSFANAFTVRSKRLYPTSLPPVSQ